MNSYTQALTRLHFAAGRAVVADQLGISVIYMLEKVGVRVTAFNAACRISKIVDWTSIAVSNADPLLLAHDEVVNAVTEAMINADS